MTATTLITDYFGRGAHSARPATPNVPAGACAFYYETDTTDTFVWNGTAWTQMNASGGGSTPAVVQQSITTQSNASTGITLGSAPTSGNLLLAIAACGLFSDQTANTGWTKVGYLHNDRFTSVQDQYALVQHYFYMGVYAKVAGGSESTTQSPVTNTGAGCIAMWELSNCFIGAGASALPGSSTTQQTGGSPLAITYHDYKVGQLTIGAFMSADAASPSATSNLSNVANTSGNGFGGTAFNNTSTAKGDVTASITHTATCYMIGWSIPVG
jgi:hypothetical protein